MATACSLVAIAYWASGGKMIEMETVEQLASIYVDGIRDLQPVGPYRIAGYSFGAVVALEIAQRLQRSGHKVEHLFILDPFHLSRTVKSDAQGVTSYGPEPKSAPSRIAKYSRESAARMRRHGFRGLATSLYKPIYKTRGGPWLMYQLFHLHRRHPSLVHESLMPLMLCQNSNMPFRGSSLNLLCGILDEVRSNCTDIHKIRD